MHITLNGERRHFQGAVTVGALLEQLGLAGKPVVVEHNKVALLPKESQTTELKEGDVVEVVQITAGG